MAEAFRRTSEEKVLRDPVHRYIHISYEVIWNLLNTRWFQRLHRIRQLGGAFTVYPTACHTRFTHSIGVYEITRRMVSEIPDIRDSLNEREKVTVMAAALLHDIGHAPYSHAFERILNVSHEDYTCRIIEEDEEIRGILEDAAPGLAADTADVIRHRSRNPLLSRLISGQLDADRMDYLLRDAYFTGTKYGEFDMERIFRTMRVINAMPVIKESGIYAVENYVMARYHSYWQVYYHPCARSYETMLFSLFQRLRDLHKKNAAPSVIPEFLPLLEGRELSLPEYFTLDESTCSYAFMRLLSCEDPIASDLAERLLNRKLFDYMEASPENIAHVRSCLAQSGFDSDYYLTEDDVMQSVYVPYTGEKDNAVWIRVHGGEIRELSDSSFIVSSLVRGKPLKDERIYFPKEIRSLL